VATRDETPKALCQNAFGVSERNSRRFNAFQSPYQEPLRVGTGFGFSFFGFLTSFL
jgi:hypothetical protein